VDVRAVVGVLVRENDRAQVLDPGVLLQVRERSVAAVDPDRRATATDEIAAAGAEGLGAVRARAPEDRQLHSHASTVSTSGPRNRAPSVRNVARSPLVTNTPTRRVWVVWIAARRAGSMTPMTGMS